MFALSLVVLQNLCTYAQVQRGVTAGAAISLKGVPVLRHDVGLRRQPRHRLILRREHVDVGQRHLGTLVRPLEGEPHAAPIPAEAADASAKLQDAQRISECHVGLRAAAETAAKLARLDLRLNVACGIAHRRAGSFIVSTHLHLAPSSYWRDAVAPADSYLATPLIFSNVR